MGKRHKKWVASAAVAALSVFAAPLPVFAQSAEISVNAQDLDDALRTLARATGSQIVFSPDMVRGKRAPAIRGDMTVESALSGLLVGSGLSFTSSGPNTFTIVAATEVSRMDDVVVVGRRPVAESMEAALLAQRNSPSIVSVVSADSIGNLPDQNVAFAVGRLPGIGVQRDQGQARYVNLRGAPTNWTTLSFDGINVISPEGRASRFDNIPSALATQIVARKAVTPDMPGETLAGNINVVTRSPFDYDGFYIAGRAGLGYVALGGGEEADISLVMSNTFANATLGVLFSGSFYHRNMATDNFEIGWERVAEDMVMDGSDARSVWAGDYRNKLYRLTRQNRSLSGRVDWRPNNEHYAFFSSIFTEYADHELRADISFDLDDRQSSTPTSPCTARPSDGVSVYGGASGYGDICTGNTPFAGTIYGIDFANTFNDLNSKEYIWTTTFGGDHSVAGWDVRWRLNYTNTQDGVDAPALTTWASPSTRTARPTLRYDFSNSYAPRIELYRTLDTGASYAAGARVFGIEEFQWDATQFRRRYGGAQSDAYTALMDASRGFELGGVATELQFGFNFADRKKISETTRYTISGAQMTSAGLPRAFNAIAQDRPYLGEYPLGYSFRYHSSPRISGIMSEAIASGFGSWSQQFEYEVSEQILAAYGMATLDFSWGDVIFGARVERTENAGSAPSTIELADGSTVSEITHASSGATMVFPSAHINWDLTRDIRLRVSFNSGAARPDFDQLSPGFEVNDEDEFASGGNPSATPERAWGGDAYLEWYLGSTGLFQVGVYHKQVEDVLFNSETLLGDVLFADGMDRSHYTLSTLVNGFEGEITGLEVALVGTAEPLAEMLGLPLWLGGFGLQANATFSDSEARAPDGRVVQLPGTSDAVYNAVLSYEWAGFSARVSWQYRTAWLHSIANAANIYNSGDTYWDDDEEIDVSLRYAMNDNIEIFFDASNLTDGPGVKYAATTRYVKEHENFGARYMLGFRFNR